MKFKLLVVLIILHISYTQAQQYTSPVNFALTLSGNVGEVRSNHFHTGIDIKALNGVGTPVLSIADGYVSRIGIAPFGYGNFICITHLDGSTSLYGHLNGLATEYQKWIEKEQYASKSYHIDRFIQKGLFTVTQGQTIGYIGNSGASAGAHLHLEIRDAVTQNPINIIAKSIYKIADHVAPIVSKVFVYQQDNINGIPIFSLTQTIDLLDKSSSTPSIKISKPAYLAYQTIDYKDGKTNTMGVYSIVQKVDSLINFSFKNDQVSFATTRYINSYIQYDKNSSSGKYDVIRAYKSPSNALNIYKNIINNGLIAPSAKSVETEILDDAGNKTTIQLSIEYSSIPLEQNQIQELNKIIVASNYFSFKNDDFTVNIPQNTLYDNAILPFYTDTLNTPHRYIVGNSNTPLHKSITLMIKPSTPLINSSKALIAKVSGPTKFSSVGGKFINGTLQTQIKTFGTYQIMYDTIAPKITAKQKNGIVINNSIKYNISDNLSGIIIYKMFVDGQWALAEYDPKNALLTLKIKPTQTTTSHEVVVEVTDYKNNKTTKKYSYKW
ncbi:MAG: M23 family metallopeptidase [Mucinivorans sp.]